MMNLVIKSQFVWFWIEFGKTFFNACPYNNYEIEN
jgi:hypothetical protein